VGKEPDEQLRRKAGGLRLRDGREDLLGTSVDAVRKRVQCGTLDAEKADGKVYVWLDADLDSPGGALIEAKDETISELRDRLEFLQRELERKDAILLNMTEAMKAIPPPAQEEPSEPSGSPVPPRIRRVGVGPRREAASKVA